MVMLPSSVESGTASAGMLMSCMFSLNIVATEPECAWQLHDVTSYSGSVLRATYIGGVYFTVLTPTFASVAVP